MIFVSIITVKLAVAAKMLTAKTMRPATMASVKPCATVMMPVATMLYVVLTTIRNNVLACQDFKGIRMLCVAEFQCHAQT